MAEKAEDVFDLANQFHYQSLDQDQKCLALPAY